MEGQMSHTRQPKVWVLVADGERARVVTPDVREGQFITALALGVAEHPHYPPDLRQDPHHLDKLQFGAEVAHRLSEEAEQGSYDQLVLVAPGHVLHAVREALSKTAASRVVGEVPKDYVRLTNPDLSALLARWWLAPADEVPAEEVPA
jgi:protein required for attachment to host cells